MLALLLSRHWAIRGRRRRYGRLGPGRLQEPADIRHTISSTENSRPSHYSATEHLGVGCQHSSRAFAMVSGKKSEEVVVPSVNIHRCLVTPVDFVDQILGNLRLLA